MTHEHLIEEAVKEALAAGMPATCCICSGPADFIGGFLPNDSQALGAPEGAARVICYSLCMACAEDPGRIEKVLRTPCGVSVGGVQ